MTKQEEDLGFDPNQLRLDEEIAKMEKEKQRLTNELKSLNTHGFFARLDRDRTGYYFPTINSKKDKGDFIIVTNFIMTPLSVVSENGTPLVYIHNGLVKPEIIEIPSKRLKNLTSFKTFMFERGPYFFDGTQKHFDAILNSMPLLAKIKDPS
tara:strand:- start:58141 stop:58596 length:456 start_codon:yes stop_codon:yes gene_type:complete